MILFCVDLLALLQTPLKSDYWQETKSALMSTSVISLSQFPHEGRADHSEPHDNKHLGAPLVTKPRESISVQPPRDVIAREEPPASIPPTVPGSGKTFLQ